MASSSPGPGQSARPGDVQTIPGLRELTREERLFLGTQAILSDWTRAQPGEDPSKTRKRRSKIKGLIQKAAAAFCRSMEVLSDLRNRRDHTTSSRRKEFKEAIDLLKQRCAEAWDLVDGLCERGIGERGFCLEIRREIRKASQEGKQAARRGGPSQQPLQEEPVSEPVEEAVQAGSETPQPGTIPACEAEEGPRAPVVIQPVSVAGTQVGPGRAPDDPVSQETGLVGGGRAVLKPVVLLRPLAAARLMAPVSTRSACVVEEEKVVVMIPQETAGTVCCSPP